MTQNVAEVLAAGQSRLHTDVGGGREVRILLAAALGIEPSELTLRLGDNVSEAISERFDAFIDQRNLHQPIAQIIGRRAFWNHNFIVTPDVLDPRPDTETLVELALMGAMPSRILDLGTGSGCILLSLLAELPSATGVGSDVSEAALGVAKQNAVITDTSDRVNFVQSDWFAMVDGQFDLIVSNPPYITGAEMSALDKGVTDWEPHLALTPGGDGLAPYHVIAQKLTNYLNPNGRALFEIGLRQGLDVQEIFRKAGFDQVTLHQDINGKDRVVQVRT
jgi:release factor glutamine methyltransferase